MVGKKNDGVLSVARAAAVIIEIIIITPCTSEYNVVGMLFYDSLFDVTGKRLRLPATIIIIM